MAEITLFTNLQKSQQQMVQLLQSDIKRHEAAEMKIQEQISGMDKKFDHITHTLAEIKLQLLKLVPESRSRNNSVLGAFYQTLGGESGASQNHIHSSLPRINFPRFDGSNPRVWILQCNNYFKHMPSIHDAQRINLAIMHFDGKALTWFQSLHMVVGITWKQFLEVVCARFEVMPVSRIILELNKLKQTENYDEYVERFEELRAYIMLNDSNKYSEDYFVASFISGLSKEWQAYIDMFQPTNLEQTIELGRKLITLDASSKKLQPPDAEEGMFEAQKANWFGIQEVETNVVQAVEDVLHSVQPMLGYATPTLALDLILEESSDIFVASKKMEERQFEVGGRVYLQLQFLRYNSVYLCQYLQSSSRFCESCQILEKKEVAAFILNLPETYAIHLHFHVSLLQRGNNIDIIPVVELSEVDTDENYKIVHLSLLGSRVINKRGEQLFPFLIPWITFGLKLVARMNAAHFRCKKHIIVQKWPEDDDNGNFNFEPLLVLTTHRVIRKSHAILQIILVQGLKIEPQFAIWKDLQPILYKTHNTHSVLCSSVPPQIYEIEEIGVLKTVLEKVTHPQPSRPISQFSVCLSHCLSVLALYSVEENKGFQKFVQRMGLPETDSHENYKIKPLLVLGTNILTRKVAQIVMTQVGVNGGGDGVKKKGISAGVPLRDGVGSELGKNADDGLKHIRRTFSSLDPRGRGSYQPGGIVMAMVMGVAGGDEKKLEMKMTLGKMSGRSDFGRRKSGWIFVIHVSAFQ